MEIRLFGCKIYISLLFLTMLTLILLIDKTGLMSVGILAVAVHESGHLIMMLILKNPPKEIIFQPCGIIIKKSDMIISSNRELLIALGGCLNNLIFAAVFALIYYIYHSDIAVSFFAANIGLILFNITCIKGLDGYDIVLIILSRKTDGDRATKICKTISIGTVIILSVGTLFMTVFANSSIMLLLCSLYLIILTLINLRS